MRSGRGPCGCGCGGVCGRQEGCVHPVAQRSDSWNRYELRGDGQLIKTEQPVTLKWYELDETSAMLHDDGFPEVTVHGDYQPTGRPTRLRPAAVTVFGGVDLPKRGREQRRDHRNWDTIQAGADQIARPT